MTAFLALAGALIVGGSDFVGGLASRSAPPARVTAWTQVASLALIGAAVWFVAAPAVTTTDVTAGAVAGLSGSFSFIAFYAAFARGQISVLAPTTAVVGAVGPTVVGLVRGESLGLIAAIGVVIALVAIVLVTQEAADEPRATPPSAFALAVVAGLGFSIFFLALAETNEDAGLWPLVVARSVSVPAVALVALRFTRGIALPTGVRGLVLASGIGEAIASVFALLAFQRGPLAVAAVLSGFYPVSTVLLARVVIGERLRGPQLVGVGLAVAAVPLIAVP